MREQLEERIVGQHTSTAIITSFLEREQTFKRIYSSTFERRREQTARSHAYRNRSKLGHHLEIGQKVLYQNHKQDLTRSQKLQQRRLGLSTVTKRITKTTYQIQDDKDPTVIETVHRIHLVEYYPKEGSLPAIIEGYVPSDYQNDGFYERFMEQRTRGLNNPNTTEEHDSFPFPIEPLRSFPPTHKPKRSSMHSYDSGVTSPLASSRTPVLSPAIPLGTSTPHPSSSQHAQSAELPPGNLLAQFNNSFVTVPPAWLKIALNRAPKSPNTIAHNPPIPILNQYCEQLPGRAINFDPLYRIATVL